MLQIGKGKPKATPVMLAEGAVVWVRPATSLEVEVASTRARDIVFGLAAGAAAAMSAAELLGEEFEVVDFKDKHWAEAVVSRLITVELAVVCCEKWTGLVDSLGAELPLSRGALTLLMQDPKYSEMICTAINSVVHQEYVEQKKSQASPSGGAKGDASTAATAAQPTAPAPEASASKASSVQRSSSGRQRQKA